MNTQKIAAELCRMKAYNPVPDGMIRDRLRRELGVAALTAAPARAALAALRAEVTRQQTLRRQRQQNRPLPRIVAHPLVTADRYLSRNTMNLADVQTHVRRHYRLGERNEIVWDCLPTIQLLNAAESRLVSTSKEQNWDVYRGAWKGWAANVYEHTITVSPALISGRLRQLGIETVDGMLTLAALRVPCPKGVEVYEAVWLVQKQGCSLGIHRGYIAVRRRAGQYGERIDAVHGYSVRGAVHTLARRITGSARRADLAVLPAEALLARAEEAARRNPNAVITMADARRAGYCDSGIRSYCYRSGIGDALVDGRITAARLYEALERAWDPLAARLLISVAERRRRSNAA